MKHRPTPLDKQHDAVFTVLDDDGTETPVPVATTSGQKHANRLRDKTNATAQRPGQREH